MSGGRVYLDAIVISGDGEPEVVRLTGERVMVYQGGRPCVIDSAGYSELRVR